jgi:hypothetical protein
MIIIIGCADAGVDAHDLFGTAGPAWTATSAGGQLVEVRTGELPLMPGRNVFRVRSAAPVVSADLVSPTMANHGITRYAPRRETTGDFLIDADIPMAGDWVLYVNLDEGQNAAAFSFEVSEWPGR